MSSLTDICGRIRKQLCLLLAKMALQINELNQN